MSTGSGGGVETRKDDLQFKKDIYRYVSDITESLTDGDEQDTSERLEEEYGVEMYPIDLDDRVSGLDYINAGFALSSLLAKEYSTQEDIFFSNRAEGFSEMVEEKQDDDRNLKKPELIQYARLYSEVADEEDIELDYSPRNMLLINMDRVRGSVNDMLRDLNKNISS